MEIVYYVATSLDGFIATSTGEVGWLDTLPIDHQATGYDAFWETVDGLVMGRNTYDFVWNHGEWPYGDRPVWVCTRRDLVAMDGCNLQPERQPEAAIARSREMGIKKLWLVGGGQLARTLLEQGNLTHLSVSVMPILLGAGVPLVAALPQSLILHQEQSVAQGGFTQIDYRLGDRAET